MTAQTLDPALSVGVLTVSDRSAAGEREDVSGARIVTWCADRGYRVAEQAIVTRILIEDGNTAVIGGLLSTTEADTIIKIPFLSAIPLLGNLFKNKINRKEVRNLVIFVTPTIVRTRTQGRSLFNRNLKIAGHTHG